MSKRDLRGLLEIEILERAQDDIFNIIEFGSAEHGEAEARDYVGKIAARINWLSANPGLGPVHSELRGGVRSFRQGQHRIYYQSSARKLTVVRILHLSMDIRIQFE
ncbi:MAG TPA: type II toxin-antitoxin system RelE/ParE family toxin [Sphingorhabdus sp.]|uniref:type II toxin-antitoxin system RelE/ParE family toxin n=1 Tax=Sphingorhabdus sp. TaxID=1902408 RepID=UPI002CD87120|nr:type II toxin-antitoxin system RelE/ParE family toxin [Sphingorhabdus sp.]HMU23037.1 type II toxin-antitoxin system RelE/ParE family toxin [Sphingorhabdus sp.]